MRSPFLRALTSRRRRLAGLPAEHAAHAGHVARIAHVARAQVALRHVTLALAGALVAAPPALAATSPIPAARTVIETRQLPRSVEAALARAGVPREAMVAWVQDVDAPRPRLAWQPDKPVNPASLMKLITTYAGLELLGPAYTWATPVWLQGPVVDGVLAGNVHVKGTGDPKLVLERMWLLVRRLQQMGIREIRGDIVLDRSAFSPGDANAGDFDGEPLRPYNAGADALLLNFRAVVVTFTPEPVRGVATVGVDPPLAGVRADASVPLVGGACDDWRGVLRAELADPTRLHFAGAYPAACGEKTWPIAYADPRSFNERALAGLWQEQGGRLTGVVRDGPAPTTTPSFELRSPTLAEVVRDINKLSNNVMAQQLFLTLGATQRGAGTPEAARDVIGQFLRSRVGIGVAQTAVVVNGSGLSRESRVSATLLGRLLAGAWASAVMPELVSSLPVAGIDGTMRRSRGVPGRAHLKTGSLRDVVGVAGYVLADSGRRQIVVGIVNHPDANSARPALEALTEWAANDRAAAPASAPPEPP